LNPIVVAITGASGACYGLRLIELLLASRRPVALILSDAGRKVLNFERGLDWPEETALLQTKAREHFGARELLRIYGCGDLFASVASGSSAPEAVVILPCSMGTLGRIAQGLSGNLIERVADVALKERRPLILAPRETPLHSIHLENMLRLSRAGAIIAPAMPAFYQRPATLEDLTDFMAGKILDLLRIPHSLFPRWGATEQEAE